jgi:glycosyltransferase involved in cell wall biosynthesis
VTDKTLLTVCMIVKNEVHTLKKTLESVGGVADRVCLLDTGSTDGTQDLARAVVGDKLDLFEEPFVDFSTSRNRCLDLAGEHSTFILSLDADDVLVNGERLREFLTSVRTLKGDGYSLKIAVTGALFTTVRLFRSRARWRYVGAVHEILLPPGQGSYPADLRLIDGVRIDHYPDVVGNEKTSARWERDVKLLHVELEANPENARACFYLARTLKDLGRHLEAFKFFERRWKMGGFKEETFIARLYGARCARAAGLPWNSCVALWLAAHGCDPTRVEPLADLVAEYSARDEHTSCVLFAMRAMALPPPSDSALFVEDWDYLVAHHLGWHAFYVPDLHEVGMEACKRAIALRPEGSEQDVKNLALYLQRGSKRKLSAEHLRALRKAL